MLRLIHNKYLWTVALGCLVILAVVSYKWGTGANATDRAIALMDTTAPKGNFDSRDGTPPVCILMDTIAPKGIFDPDNITTGHSNSDELYKVLAGPDAILLPGSLHKEAIGADWARDASVVALKPDLVIIHRSSFFHPLAAKLKMAYPPFANAEDQRKWQDIYDAQDVRLRSFIGLVGSASLHCQFLVYARGTDTNWLNQGFRSNWTATLESSFPNLQGRIQTMVIPNGRLGTFRDPATMDEVRSHVREMLKSPQKNAPEKRN